MLRQRNRNEYITVMYIIQLCTRPSYCVSLCSYVIRAEKIVTNLPSSDKLFNPKLFGRLYISILGKDSVNWCYNFKFLSCLEGLDTNLNVSVFGHFIRPFSTLYWERILWIGATILSFCRVWRGWIQTLMLAFSGTSSDRSQRSSWSFASFWPNFAVFVYFESWQLTYQQFINFLST